MRLDEPPRVVNVGLDLFAESLRQQAAEVVHVAWAPPARGDAEVLAILSRLRQREADDEKKP